VYGRARTCAKGERVSCSGIRGRTKKRLKDVAGEMKLTLLEGEGVIEVKTSSVLERKRGPLNTCSLWNSEYGEWG